MHVGLYVFMFAMPIAGWLLLSAEGKAIPFFGFSIPALIAEHKDWSETIKEVHEAGGTVGYVLIGLHSAAALIHHYFFKDNTLRRMLPGHA
jgi:cytochrome b561